MRGWRDGWRWAGLGLVGMVGVVVGAGSVLAAPPRGASPRPATRPAPAPAPVVRTANPLLPPQIAIDGLFPDLALAPKMPSIAPQTITPLYAGADWSAWREKWGVQADSMTAKKASQQDEFALQLVAAAEGEHEGLRRLLLLRAVGLTYRHGSGIPVVHKAVAAFRADMDINSPAQCGALFAMADAPARLASTPKADRTTLGQVAAQANVQLAMLLLEAGQIEAAGDVLKLTARHEVAVRADATLRGQVAQAKALVRDTATMLDYLAAQQQALARDETAAMPLYLYAKLVKPTPAIVNDLLARRGNNAVGQLEGLLAKAEGDPMAAYQAAEALRATAANLPEGMLKRWVLHAALQRYQQFSHSPETEAQRIPRTLARMAMEAVRTDGARGRIHLRPLEPPPPPPPAATGPAVELVPLPGTAPGSHRGFGPATGPAAYPVPMPPPGRQTPLPPERPTLRPADTGPAVPDAAG